MTILLTILAVCTAIVAFIYLIVPIMKGIAWLVTNFFKGIAWLFRHVFSFVFGMIGDFLRSIGAVITAVVFVPLVLLNVLIGRWSAAAHFGRGLQDELKTFGHCVYRVVIGHPAKFFLLSGLVEGIEKRLPQAMAESPGSDKPSRRTGQFDGYTIVGSLQGGGSGGRLYVANPDEKKRAIFARNNHVVDQVVIKAFSLHDGSSLPQIIRESRALESARKLGLVLDHELSDTRFYYVMPYVPGDSLTAVTRRMHAESGAAGLSKAHLVASMGYIGDLLSELSRYHHGGLWHKDVKPDNIIISDERAKLVDLGLVTPLRSAMTLTTHGTEYFRDPEMVRMALRGAKVRDVDGVKFDLYGTGAVMYSVLEGQFPAHGGLSQLSKNCPEALRWIVRRAMTELNNRYSSADEMLADLNTVIEAKDPWALKPIDLPSVKGGEAAVEAVAAAEQAAQERFVPTGVGAPAAVAAQAAAVGAEPGQARATPSPFGRQRSRPKLQVTDWLTGRYIATDRPLVNPDAPTAGRGGAVRAPLPHRGGGMRRSAQEQLEAARSRLERAQNRAAGRARGRRAKKFSAQPNAGVFVALFFLVGAVAMLFFAADRLKSGRGGVSFGVNELTEALEIRVGDNVIKVPGVRIASDDETVIDMKELNAIGERASRDLRPLLDAAWQPPVVTPAAAPPAPAAAYVPAAPTAPFVPVSAVAPTGRGVLVLDTLPKETEFQGRPALDEVARSLRRSGFTVYGLGSGATDSELLAMGRRAIELGTPDDEDAVARVQRWLDTGDSTLLDAVLWVGQGRSGDDAVVRLLVRSGVDPELLVETIRSEPDH